MVTDVRSKGGWMYLRVYREEKTSDITHYHTTLPHVHSTPWNNTNISGHWGIACSIFHHIFIVNGFSEQWHERGALQPISMSSLVTANWSRGSEWQLNRDSHIILMLHHRWAGLASTGKARENKTSAWVQLLCCKATTFPSLHEILLPEETSQTARSWPINTK